ncbi:Uncharacterised protein [Mycobacteroides abscessus subsp. abscessus]|uniref:hypothetical protein n=1 Tax=Mycobacteroides abscessus TaxID=36809 RepID=UPI0009A84426|nr:hypothetical protein [Mycobacteroides abscessus]SLI00804.1 Uncharacterised protein [Mycobacteroides abscessus subsp. abscessus]
MQTNIVVPQEMLSRIDHLMDHGNGPVGVPEAEALIAGRGTMASAFDFPAQTVLYPVPGAPHRYLIALRRAKDGWTLVALDYLAHGPACQDSTCRDVHSRLAEQRRHIPRHGMLFARTLVDPNIQWLPLEIPYLIHIDDYPQFKSRRMQPFAELDLPSVC